MRVRRAQARLSAGGTPALPGTQTCPCKPFMGEGIRRMGFELDFGWRAWLQPSVTPAFAGMTADGSGNDGAESGNPQGARTPIPPQSESA